MRLAVPFNGLYIFYGHESRTLTHGAKEESQGHFDGDILLMFGSLLSNHMMGVGTYSNDIILLISREPCQLMPFAAAS